MRPGKAAAPGGTKPPARGDLPAGTGIEKQAIRSARAKALLEARTENGVALDQPGRAERGVKIAELPVKRQAKAGGGNTRQLTGC